MITVLAVGEDAEALASFGTAHPSVEVVTARDAEDALERLARNRRIDAVLLLDAERAADAAALIREEDPGAPPIYAPAALPGARSIERGTAAAMLDRVLRELADGA